MAGEGCGQEQYVSSLQPHVQGFTSLHTSQLILPPHYTRCTVDVHPRFVRPSLKQPCRRTRSGSHSCNSPSPHRQSWTSNHPEALIPVSRTLR